MKHLFCVAMVLLLAFSGGYNILLGTEESASPPFVEITRDAVSARHEQFVTSVAFSPDGKRIAVADFSGIVLIWDAVLGKELQRLPILVQAPVLPKPIDSVCFSPNGEKIVAGGSDGIIRVWDAKSGTELYRWDIDAGMINAIALSPDGEKIVVGGKNIRVLDIDSGRTLPRWRRHTHTGTGGVLSVSVSPDGKKIVTTSEGPDWATIIWDTESGEELRKLEWHTPVPNLANFSPDGKTIVTSAFRRIGGLDRDHDYTVRIWDTETGKELRRLEGHTGAVRSATFSPDGAKIVTGGNDKSVRIWDTESGKELQKLDVPMDIVNRVGFAPDGKKVVATMRNANSDYVVRIWTLE